MDEPRAADVPVLTEDELGLWRREQGHRIVRHRGRLWWDHRGLCRLLHFAAAIPADLVGRPTARCWAYHAPLQESDRALANATAPLHLVEDVATFDQRRVDSTARKQLRRCHDTMRLVRIDEPDVLLTQGWDVFSQNARRLGLDREVTEARYLAAVRPLVSDPRMVVVGAMEGDRLLGYQETFAADGIAYLREIRLSDEAMSRHVSGFLYFETIQLYRRTQKVTKVCAGLPLLERPGVTEFKRRWGIPLLELPARFWAPAPARQILRRMNPDAFYWATGSRPGDSVASSPR